VCYSESRKVGRVYWAPGIVREALVALLRGVLVNCDIALLIRERAKYRQVVEPVGFHLVV
jgi:hypothetical protein